MILSVLRPACGALAVALAPLSVAGTAAPPALGIFTGLSDVGTVRQPTQVEFDGTTTYRVAAGGANMWFAEDDFGFVWKRASGDIALAADVSLVGQSKEGHRKGLLMIRQSLDPAAPYADVAVHGDGLTSLQFRSEQGGVTREIRCPIKSPRRVRLEKRGAYVFVSVAGADGVLSESGCFARVSFGGGFYVGLGACAHDNTAFETAQFSGVELGAPSPWPETFSALEVVPLASLDRSVVFRAVGRLEAPVFAPNGEALYFNRAGRIERLTLAPGAVPVVVDTGSAQRCNNDHGVSPDGTQLVISDLTETGKSLIYLVPIAGGAPKRIPIAEPAYWHGWADDGKTLVYCAARGGNYDIYAAPVSGGPEQRLTTSPANDNGPDCTPDGKWIYFHSDRSGAFQLWRMLRDVSQQEQVTHDDFENWFPHPSPDGKWIAFLSTKTRHATGHPPDADYSVRVMPTGTTAAPREVARIYGGNGSFNVPCWSRDSTRLAYAVFSPATATSATK